MIIRSRASEALPKSGLHRNLLDTEPESRRWRQTTAADLRHGAWFPQSVLRGSDRRRCASAVTVSSTSIRARTSVDPD